MGNRSKQLPESIVQCRDCLAAMIRYCDRDDLEWSWSWCATVRCSGVTPGLAPTTLRKLLAADNQENTAIIYGWVLAQLWIILHAFHLYFQKHHWCSLYIIYYCNPPVLMFGRARTAPAIRTPVTRQPLQLVRVSMSAISVSVLLLCSGPSVPQPVVQSRRRPLVESA